MCNLAAILFLSSGCIMRLIIKIHAPYMSRVYGLISSIKDMLQSAAAAKIKTFAQPICVLLLCKYSNKNKENCSEHINISH